MEIRDFEEAEAQDDHRGAKDTHGYRGKQLFPDLEEDRGKKRKAQESVRIRNRNGVCTSDG
jgi:hypothetical protein